LALYFAASFFPKENLKMVMRKAIPFIIGAAVVFSFLLFMKFDLAPKSDLAPTTKEVLLQKLTTVSRYTTIQKGLVKNSKNIISLPIILLLLLSFIKTRNINWAKRIIGLGFIIFIWYYPYLLPLVALGFLLTGMLPKTNTYRAAVFSFSAINLMLLGYVFIYVITPNDLKWHINTSMNRLLIQLIPAIIFAIALTFNEEKKI
jgi:hypothetical protein